ncbi:OmpA family protein [Luteibacter sp.]|uniref:OmpA family protein n=1 Tax=Luteibacter sp. TaxID=1886636 RepID=UPI002809249F|nr:OmpA family protein [Luteibacter sp.]MDQ8051344.1 OmpA family protein [Luteibacter sp.]
MSTQGLSIFENIIEQASVLVGDRRKGTQLVGMLVALVFNEKRGGSAGFIQAFRNANLGHVVASWLGKDANCSISTNQLESVLGPALLGSMASHLALTQTTTLEAATRILPEVVGALAQKGHLPNGSTVPEGLRGLVGGIGDFVGTLGQWGWGGVAAGTAAVAGGIRVVDRTAPKLAQPPRKRTSSWLIWLLLLAAFIGALLLYLGYSKQQPVTAPAETRAPVPAATVEQVDPRLRIDNTDGKVAVTGQLASEPEKTRLMEALRAAFGGGNVSGDITVDTTTAPARWMDKLIALLPELKASGIKLGFDGDKLQVDTSALPEDQRIALSHRLRTEFPSLRMSGLWDKAMAALSMLKAGFTSDDLVKALNLSTIYFETGSAKITGDSMETLVKAAEAIKAAPAGTRIEIGGHTDNSGDAAINMAVSQQRAEAVKTNLVELGVAAEMLDARGFGQDKPVADNATEEGRAQNRRIEFTALKN